MKYIPTILYLTLICLGLLNTLMVVDWYAKQRLVVLQSQEESKQRLAAMDKARDLCEWDAEYFVENNGLKWGCRGKE